MKKSLALIGVFAAAFGAASASDWPTFRGPNGGIAKDDGVPAKIDESNRLWKVKLPGPGASSPITYGNKIFLTAYSGYGTKVIAAFGAPKGDGKGPGKGAPKFDNVPAGDAGDQKNLKLHLLCIDRDSGKTVWEKTVEPKLPEAPFTGFIKEHGYATSTPATDGERVYVFFGKTGVLAYSMAGEKLWQTSVGEGTDKWGTGSSPIVHDGVVIVNAAIESGSIVGLDAKTGNELWRFKDVTPCWTSPLLVETKSGGHEVVLSLPGKVGAFDPKSGKELWRCKGIGSGDPAKGPGYTSSTPVARDGIVYAVGGGGPSPAVSLAVKTGGKGDVDDTHVIWRQSLGTGIASPVLDGNFLCWISGSATVLDAKSGTKVSQERLYDSRSEYVSPVLAGDRIYALTRADGLYVLSGQGKLKELDHIDFPGDSSLFNASPAVSDGKLIVRSNEFLYCFGKK
jgi:outer membrane protein assembly factor BamB